MKPNQRSNDAKKGFTLIELLVVVAIIGVLATIVVVNLNSAREKSKTAKTRSNIKQFMTAADLYWTSKGYYPDDNAFNSNMAAADSELKSMAGSSNFVDGWGNGMDYDNMCSTSTDAAPVYRNGGTTGCDAGKDNSPGPVGIYSDGPDGGRVSNDKKFELSCSGTPTKNCDNVWWGVRGYSQHNWND